MSALKLVTAALFYALDLLRISPSNIAMSSTSLASSNSRTVVTDLTVKFCFSCDAPSIHSLDTPNWHRIEKELYLHTSQQQAWLYVAQVKQKELNTGDLVVTDIRIGEPHDVVGVDNPWESRPGGIWVSRSNYTGDIRQTVADVDVLFGADAVDPRPHWTLSQLSLQLDYPQHIPGARLSVQRGNLHPEHDVPWPVLKVREDGTFKIVQISDTHLVTGVGVCKDATDAHGQPLPDSEADPLTIDFIEGILDVEKPDLVLLTGDQVHHDIPDTQSALLKVFAPLIARSIPYAIVFGNHDSEGTHALSRTSQMALLESLPFSLCQSGPEDVDGIGNYYLQVSAHAHSHLREVTLYLLDSHGQIPSNVQNPDYDPIKQTQIDWFTSTSQALRKTRENHGIHDQAHLSLAFMHIPLPEFGDENLIIHGGQRREPTEGPSVNTHFYTALAKEGVAAVGGGHDHVNDFCALLPESGGSGQSTVHPSPWLCYGGASGFGGYCSYDGIRYHRRARVWEIDTNLGLLKTWKRVQFAQDRVDELQLVGNATAVSSESSGQSTGGPSAQARLDLKPRPDL